MNNRYIALYGCAQLDPGVLQGLRSALHEFGMQERPCIDSLRLFVSPDTPTLDVPGGGIVIGHLFSRSGSLLTRCSDLPPPLSADRLRDHLLNACWGGYVLIQPEDGGTGISVMRDPSPSGDVPCVHLSGYGGVVIVASDISLPVDLGLHRKHIDWDFVAHRLVYPHVKTERTGLTGVQELLPGCRLHIRPSRRWTEMAWSPWKFVAHPHRHTGVRESASAIRDAVQVAVGAWANIDKSILLELSGGLDSSIVAACLRATRAKVVCCTLLAPLPGADERQYAGLVAAQLGVPLHAVDLGFHNARFSFAPPERSLSPRVGPLQFAVNEVMEAAANRHGVASFFSGGGGDTVFGYLRTAAPAADAFKEHGFRAGVAAIQDLADLHDCTIAKAAGLTFRKLFRSPKAPCKRDESFVAPDRLGVELERHPWFSAPPAAWPGDRERVFDLASNQMFRDNVPRGTARPMRMPLLSQPVVEACLGAPSWMWIANGRNRSLARAAFRPLLPPEIVDRRSKGTFMGYLGAIYQRNRMQMREFLLDGHLQARNLLDAKAVERFLESPLAPRDQTFTRIFDLCMVENWVRGQVPSDRSPA